MSHMCTHQFSSSYIRYFVYYVHACVAHIKINLNNKMLSSKFCIKTITYNCSCVYKYILCSYVFVCGNQKKT